MGSSRLPAVVSALLSLAIALLRSIRACFRSRSEQGRIAVVAGLPLAVLTACGPRYDAPVPVRNVLLVSIDTLRADHLGVYDPRRETTPRIDAWAQHAAVFETAIAPSPMTLPSHATLLTGQLPPRHGVRDNDGYRLAQDRTTLAERLRAAGLVTGAVVGADILARRYGLDQGFDVYDDEVGPFFDAFHTRPASAVTAAARRFLEQHGTESFFLFVHYYDPHFRYDPPEPFRSRFAEDPYSGEVAYTDDALGALLDALEEQELDEATLVIVTADHGEALGEHGEIGHSYFVYQVTQHVPLLIRAPGMARGRRLGGAVSLADVAPTVLAVLGLDPLEETDGRDLAPLLRGEVAADPARRVYGESLTPTKLGCSPLLALVSERWKYIHTTRPELYDLDADPGEERDLATQEPERVARFAAEVETIRRSARPGARYVDPEIAGFLNALGYLKGEVDERARVDPAGCDPKDGFPTFERLRQLAGFEHEGQHARARELALAVLRERPDLIDLHRRLGDLAFGQRGYADAIGHYERFLALRASGRGLGLRGDPGRRRDFDLHLRLGVSRAETGSPEAAVAEFRRAISAAPELPSGHANLGRALIAAGRPTEAAAPLREALRLDPGHARARADLASLAGAEPGEPSD